MEKLLKFLFKDNKIRYYKKDDIVSSITIFSVLVYLVCKSLSLKLKEINTIKFFDKICETPAEFQFQFFSQFIINEGHFKAGTLTIPQKKNKNKKRLYWTFR